MERFESTSLWMKSLARKDNDPYENRRDEIRLAYLDFRRKVSSLVSRISSTLPNLTQHDISHLDALWETASLIAGPNYPLNPLEGFVLGGAILLHDSALCFEAYENGIDGVRETVVWKDAYAAVSNENQNEDEASWKEEADFIALRHLHAEQSSKLVEASWSFPDSAERIYLIENTTLRRHLGQLLGEISASHHWDIEKVASTFSSQVNSPSPFPREWRIDPVKIACLLRCADATHIDNERAPDFLYALIKREGISFNHWQSQNRLANADIDQSDPNASNLLFTSTKAFTEVESKSWWIAYDAACLVDQEVRASNALLESLKTNTILPFKVKSVKGVESPDLMTKYIKVNGWAPCSAKLHIGNIENLVKMLGGEQLYGLGSNGDMFQVVVRELVQNARDAVMARAAIEPHFLGKIIVSVFCQDHTVWLTVEDNGVGMSERVLTGPLLDFGTSFWASSLVRSEFPGLRSSNFKSVGQYGIGFYSTFMISDQVYISSRSWQKGISDVMQVDFDSGLTLRPLLKKGAPVDFNSSTSTKVKLRLKSGIINEELKIKIKRNLMGSVGFEVQVKDYISALCSGLDTNVYFKNDIDEEIQIHQSINTENFNIEKWLKQLSFSLYQGNTVNKYITDNLNRIRTIKENGRIVGRAAISTILQQTQNFLSVTTIGGLAGSVHERDGNTFIGYMDASPKSAKREISHEYVASKQTLKCWAEEQFEIISRLELNAYERHVAAINLANYGVDSSSIALILVSINGQQSFRSIQELAVLSQTTDIAFLRMKHHPEHMEVYTRFTNYPNDCIYIVPLVNSSYLSLEFDNDEPRNFCSLIGCLHKAIVDDNKSPQWKTSQTLLKNGYGQELDALILSAAVI